MIKQFEKRLLFYSSSWGFMLIASFILIGIVRKIGTQFAFFLLAAIFTFIFVDILMCFLRTKVLATDGVFLGISMALGFLDILTTMIASRFDVGLFRLIEMNPLAKACIDDRHLVLSIIVMILVKMIFHASAAAGAKAFELYRRNGSIRVKEIYDYPFSSHFWYLRSVRTITDPLVYIKDGADGYMGKDLAFSVAMSARSDIIAVILFYFIVVINNSLVIALIYSGAPQGSGKWLKIITVACLLIIVILSQVLGFISTKKRLGSLCQENGIKKSA
ncbi:MAG: hypothetical protein A2Y35_08830 [Spirochaetes bacterium GWE1_60_18]|nr:MAG: hypothetical protein A2Y35_08830 [Spirochaetes bacterium GWE1_60_18]